MITSVEELTEQVLNAYRKHSSAGAFTVGVSGIDASGKGYITKLLQEALEQNGYRVANINIDPWQNPKPVRLQKENAAENFYKNVFRWNDVFSKLLIPLKTRRSIHLETELIRTDADEYYTYIYHYPGIDFLLIDAILLFQEKFLPFFDLKIWVHCSFEKGMKRALARNVERLDEEMLVHDYNRYYYAAQRIHYEKDNPMSAADIIFDHEEDVN